MHAQNLNRQDLSPVGVIDGAATISAGVDSRVLRADALENVCAFLAVKAIQGIPAEDIDVVGHGYLIPESFKFDRGVHFAFRP
jgi:hypothetical protein